MNIDNTKAINKMCHAIGRNNRFTAEVSVNEYFFGNHSGMINLNNVYSSGKIEIADMDNEKFYTGFNASFQDFHYDANNNEMHIMGFGNKKCMNGSYEVILRNIKGY